MKIRVARPSDIPQDWYGQLIGFDIETSDKTLDADICMVSVYNPVEDLSLVIGVKVYRKGKLQVISDEELDILKKFLSSIQAVGHYLQFDLSFVQFKWGIKIKVGFDTYILSRMLQLESNALKEIYSRLFPDKASVVYKFGDVMGEAPWDYNIDDPVVVRYSGLDSALPFRIMDYYKNYVSRNDSKRILDMEFKFVETSADIRAEGINVDMGKFQEFRRHVVEEYNKKATEFSQNLGRSFRCNSSADIESIIVGDLGLVPPLKTKTGKYSMSSECLEIMADMYDSVEVRQVIEEILELKHLFSVVNSTKKVPEFVSDKSKIHPTVEQIGYDGTSRVYTCIEENERVKLEDGSELPIKDIEVGMTVKSGIDNISYVNKILDQGVKKIVEIELEDGRTLKLTDDHRVGVLVDGEVKFIMVKDLTEDSELITI